MFVAVKSPCDGNVDAILVKYVLSVWPQFVEDRYVTTVCNIALSVKVSEQSTSALTRLILLAERRFFSQVTPTAVDISHTLLDGSNPLTYMTQGLYRREPGSRRLAYYDGLPAVAVDCTSEITATAAPDWEFVRFEVALSRSVAPGTCAAVRFWFHAPGVFAAAEDGLLRFDLPVQSEYPLMQFVSSRVLAARALPMLTIGADNLMGGMDVFIYQPLEFDGDDFNYPPSSRLLPDYDHLGRRGAPPRLKFAWTGTSFKPLPGTPILVTDRIVLRGTFRRRNRMNHIVNYNNYGPGIAGNVSAGAIAQNGNAIAVENPAEALRLLEQLRDAVGRVSGDPASDAVALHVDDIEELVRGRRFGTARERVSALAEAAKSLSERTAPVLDLVERLTHVL